MQQHLSKWSEKREMNLNASDETVVFLATKMKSNHQSGKIACGCSQRGTDVKTTLFGRYHNFICTGSNQKKINFQK